jgi:hypothetical protein
MPGGFYKHDHVNTDVNVCIYPAQAYSEYLQTSFETFERLEQLTQ